MTLSADGASIRRLECPGVEVLIGRGVHYGSAPGQAPSHRDADVVLVGGANSAGQAALHLAAYARTVTMLVRGPSLAAGMSQYLVDRILAHPRIDVGTATRVVTATGERGLERITIANRDGRQIDLPAQAMYVLIGGAPLTAGSPAGCAATSEDS